MRNKSPAFQFYPGDWLQSMDVCLMSAEQEGAYIRLLCYDWDCDGIPEDDKSLAVLSRLNERWTDVGTLVKQKFETHPTKPNTITNPRLRKERENQEQRRQQQSAAGRRSAQVRGIAEKSKEVINSTSVQQAFNKRSTSVAISLQRNVNSSSSSSTTSSLIKKSTSTKKKSTLPKYKQPDRSGNPRELVPGFKHIHLSAPERERIKAEAKELGITREQLQAAVEKVDVWFEENPAKLAKSSEHVTRILDWGFKSQIEKQTTVARASRAKAIEQSPIGPVTAMDKYNKNRRQQDEELATIRNGELDIEAYLGINGKGTQGTLCTLPASTNHDRVNSIISDALPILNASKRT